MSPETRKLGLGTRNWPVNPASVRGNQEDFVAMKKKLLSIVGLCFIVCLSIAMFTPDLYAQGDSKGPRKVFNAKTGQLEIIEEEKTGGPTKMQMGIGIGSIPVAYMVLKYL